MSTTPERYTVEGADTVARTMAAAGRELADLTKPSAAVAQLVASAARATAPRLSGDLAASTVGFSDKTTASVGSDLIYAPPIHNGWRAHNIEANPYITRAFESTEDRWRKQYEDAAVHAAEQVKGA